MANNLQELGQKFQDLAARSLQEQVRAAQRYAEAAQQFGRGDLLQKPAQDAYVRFVSEEAEHYVSNLVSLHLKYYEGLIEIGRAYNDRFFNQVVSRTGASAAAATRGTPGAVPARRVEVELRGTVGQAAVRSFVLESKYSEATDISFLVSDFVGPEAGAPFRANLEFQPARFTLRPGEEQLITLSLQLDPALFVAGSRYRATVVVRGYDDLELGINVLAVAPEVGAAENTSPPAPAGTPS